MKSPSVVLNVAVYFLAGSMQVGGGPANFSTRLAEPAAGGHGVASVSVSPFGGVGSSAVSLTVVVLASVVVDPLEDSFLSSPPVMAMTPTMSATTARPAPRPV